MNVVLCNCPPTQATSIGRELVQKRLAACVNLIGPVRSVYEWNGTLCDEEEMTLLIKVAANGVEALVCHLQQSHPYDTPEIIVLPVDVGMSNPRYVQWVRDASGGAE